MKKSEIVSLSIGHQEYLLPVKDAATVMSVLRHSIVVNDDWHLNLRYGYDSPSLEIKDSSKQTTVFEKDEEELFATYIQAQRAEKELAKSSNTKFILKDFHVWKKEFGGQ